MWSIRCRELDRRNLLYSVDLDSHPASFAAVLRGWAADPAFRALFSDTLAGSPHQAFRWETPAVTTATMSQPFEFVLLDSPALLRRPDPEPFAEHFGGADGVVAFRNVGGDALLIVPCPLAAPTAYGHLAAFVRGAPARQQHTLWQTVADAMAQRIGSTPVWLSTAGGGVAWVHVRLDDRPKYYAFPPYRLAG